MIANGHNKWVSFYCWGCLSEQIYCALHQGNSAPLYRDRTSSSVLEMSNQKANMIKELRNPLLSAQPLMIKPNLTAMTTVFLRNEDMRIAGWTLTWTTQ